MTEKRYARKVPSVFFDPLKGKSPILSQLDIELTERCNNRCIHCFINRPEHDFNSEAREMNTNFIIDLLRQASELGCFEIRFTGGEPLLRPDFSEIYLAARRLGMRVVLFTNARLITPALAALLTRVPPGRMVEVSVYGMSARSYDAVTGVRGAFNEFRRGIDLLLENGVPFAVKGAILPQNRDEMPEFEAWARTIAGEKGLPNYAMNYDLRARRDDCDKNQRIAALRLTPEETVTMLAREPAYFQNIKIFCEKYMHQSDHRLFSCGAGCGACVDSYGYVQMCLPLRHPDTVFDLRYFSLRQILTEVFPLIRERRAINSDYHRRCAVCFLKGLCEQCPAKSWMEHGTLDTPVDYCCEVAHAQARHIGLIAETEHAWEVADPRQRMDRLSSGVSKKKDRIN